MVKKVILYAMPIGCKPAEHITSNIQQSIRLDMLMQRVMCTKTNKTYMIMGKEVNSDIEVEIKKRQIRKKHQNYIIGNVVEMECKNV